MIRNKLFTIKEIQAMNKNTTVLANLLSPLERSDFECLVKDYNGDKRIRTLSTFTLLKTLIYGQITGAFSVREIESSLAVNSSKLYHCGLKPVKRSTLCDALEKRDQHIFEKTFQSLAAKAQMIAGNNGRRFRNPLKIIDASTIDLCLNRFDWAKFRTTKGAVKLHLKLDGDYLFPEEAKLTTGSIHEVTEMSELCRTPGQIYVMDRGYVDYNRLYDIELGQSIFVTRMKRNCQHEIIKRLSSSSSEPIRLDAVIKLVGLKTKETYPKELRKVCYHDDEYDRDYVFITNSFDISAQKIADIYKARWQVELFFKWIKQNLKIKTFWGTSENAVYIQIWVALIVALLLWLHKALDGITVSSQRIIQILKSTILARKTILDLIRYDDPPDKIESRQFFFKGFTC